MTVGASLAREFHCILPWLHLYVAPDGAAYPCCFGTMRQAVGDLRRESLEEVWNGNRMREFRRRMLEGGGNEHCSRCHHAEVAGYRSFRQTSNEKFGHHAALCSGTTPSLRLIYLDFRFSNLCNFRCRTCGPLYSSAWHDDARGMDPTFDTAKSLRWGTWRDVVPHLETAEEINFAGGEPLLSKDHHAILCWLVKKKQFGVRLSYNTNLSTLSYKGAFFPDIWTLFSSVRVSVSLDDLGCRGELLRKGKSWSVFEANVKRLLEYRRTIDLGFTLTVSVFNVHAVVAVIDHLQQSGYVNDDVHVDVNFLDGPSYYSVQILPLPMKERLRRDFAIRLGRQPVASSDAGWLNERLAAVVKHMFAFDRSAEIGRFVSITRQLDQLRHEDTFAVFPELSELISLAEQD